MLSPQTTVWRVGPEERVASSEVRPHSALRFSSILLAAASVVLLVAVVILGVQQSGFISLLLALVLIALCVVLVLHTRFLLLARKEHRLTSTALDVREREFQTIFDSALDTIVILNDQGNFETVNPAAERLFGMPGQVLVGQPLVRFHKDTTAFHESWSRFLTNGRMQGYSELRRLDGSELFVEFTAKAQVLPGKNVVIIRDITKRRRAEEEVRQNLGIAKSAWAEADALRKATLALAQDLKMDYVLDTLLDSLSNLVPYECAQVLLLEGDSRLFLARESTPKDKNKQEPKYPLTFEAESYPGLQRVLVTKRGHLVSDTRSESERTDLKGLPRARSWLGVPLVGSNQILGVLSLGHAAPEVFTQEHLRAAQSLAVAAAVAIQNARLYEAAEIYSSELEKRIVDLDKAQKALERFENDRRGSEGNFQTVFRSSPIAFSIIRLEDGRFVDVNEAFERRFGYSKEEVIGRTTADVGIWEYPEEREALVNKMREGVPIRNLVTRVHLKSGEIVPTLFSVQSIEFDGVMCLLAVSGDMPESRHT